MDSNNSIEKNSARRHKFFDKGIFWESFKQQKIPGILITVIYLVEVILRFINVLINNAKITNYPNGLISGNNYTGYIPPVTLHPILSFTFIIAAPVLVLVAFNFLTKRNASDLWHSLPHKRETVFTSVFLSVAAWLVVIIVGTSIVSMTMGFFITDNVLTYLLAWLSSILTNMIQCLLMAACFTLAATLTGTVGNNFITGLLIAFGPRLLMSSIYSAIIRSIPILGSEESISFLSGGYNLISGNGLLQFLIYSFRLSRISYSYKAVYAPLIYSFVLAVVYVIIACVLFKKRKSESAGQSSLNKKLHAVFRITLCMVICVIILTSLFGRVKNGYGTVNFSYVIWFTVAVVVYFAYELITMRKFKSLVKALPGLGIVVLLNVAIYGFMVGVRSYELSYSPSEEDVESVSVELTNQQNSYTNYNIFTNAYKNVFLKETDVKKIVTEALKENAKNAKKNAREYETCYIGSDMNMNNYTVEKRYAKVLVNIDTGSNIKTRYIYIKIAELNRIRDVYFGSDEFRKTVLNLPEKFNKEASYISMTTNYSINSRIMNDEFNDIYKKYREEISACSFDDFTKSATSDRKILSLSVNVDNMNILTYPLCSELTPQSYEMSIEAMYKQSAKNQEKLLEKLSSKGSNIYIQITVIDEKQNYQANYNSGGTVAYEQAKKFILDHKVDGAPKIGDKFVYITCNITNGNYSNVETLTAIINLGNVDINNMVKYYG